MNTHVNQTKHSVTADTQPEPRRSALAVRGNVLNTWSGCIMWPHFFSPSLTSVWPSCWVSFLPLPTHTKTPKHLLPVSDQTHTAGEGPGWPSSGGWLSGRTRADSCPGDWRNERWSWLADQGVIEGWGHIDCCSSENQNCSTNQTHRQHLQEI